MTDEIQKVEAKLSLKLLLGLIGTALQETKTALKEDVHLVTLKAEKTAVQAEVRDWKINTVQVQMQNIEQRQIQQTQNIEKLLTRFRVEPKPAMKPLPLPPKPEPGDGDGN